MLNLNHLTVNLDGKNVLNDFTLDLAPGQIHVLMGPNGAGKSSLAFTIMGHPAYRPAPGATITLDGQALLDLGPDRRAQAGLFLGFQTPVVVEGISVQNFLKTAYESLGCAGCLGDTPCPRLSVGAFRALLASIAASLQIDLSLLSRSLNDGFSGGEKKRLEILQLLVLKPKYAILDEPDSGLDIDALKIMAAGIEQATRDNHTGILLITHYSRLLDYLSPLKVSIMRDGHLVKTGSPKLVKALEATGYQAYL